MKPRHYRAVIETKEIAGVHTRQILPQDIIIIDESEFEITDLTYSLTPPHRHGPKADALHIGLCNRKTSLLWEIQVPQEHKFRIRRTDIKRVGVDSMVHKGLYGSREEEAKGDVCMALISPLSCVVVLVDPETLELVTKYPSGTYEVWEEVT